MKRVINFLIGGMILMSATIAVAQRPDQQGQNKQRPVVDRMGRDIAVMETALSEMIKQEFDQRNFYFLEVHGNYIPGYGVTFTIPTSMFNVMNATGTGYVSGGPGYNYVYFSEDAAGRKLAESLKSTDKADKANKEREKTPATDVTSHQYEQEVHGVNTQRGLATARTRKQLNTDSLNAINNAKIVNAAKTFIADYGDMLSQLATNERIVVSNRGANDNHFWYNGVKAKRTLLNVEVTKSDLTQFRQGNITRDQLLGKIKVTNTESSGQREPDLEVLSSAFSRLYDRELSSTYFMQGNSYYERLTDFGAIVYMQVYSSNQTSDGLLIMPTVNLREVDQETRDKKVKELYPVFEKDLKENILQYGSLVRSLKDSEQLVFSITLTKCKGCGIPSDIEVSAPLSVLRDYSSGKVDKNSALGKITVKKGAEQ